jgi:hypothetical protein
MVGLKNQKPADHYVGGRTRSYLTTMILGEKKKRYLTTMMVGGENQKLSDHQIGWMEESEAI